MRLASLVVAGLLVPPGAAHAVLPPFAYLEARASAEVHLQVRVTRVRLAPRDNACRIEGRALSVWRGSLKAGETIRFRLPCRFPSTPVMPGPVLWFDPGALRAGQVLEGFFDTGEAGLRPARDQVFIFGTASDTPRCGTTDYPCREESPAP